MKKIFIEYRNLTILYVSVALVLLLLSVIFQSKLLPTAFSFLTLFGVFLNSIFLRSGQLLFAASALIYIIMAQNESFYGEIVLYSLFFIFYTVSFIRWKRKKFQISSVSFFQFIIIILFGVIFTVVYYWFLSQINTSQILLNSLSTTIACLAVFCTTNKKWQQFYFWIAISMIQIILWLTTFSINDIGNLPVVIVNIFLVAINIYNLIVWKKKFKNIHSPAAGG